MKNIYFFTFFLLILLHITSFAQEKAMPINQWVKIGEAPADPLNRDTAYARGSSWAYNTDNNLFYRYGGFTPRYNNSLTSYDVKTKKWVQIVDDDENYPDDRPAGMAGASMAYDKVTKRVWIAAGFGGNGSMFKGKIGVWYYDVPKKEFKFFKELPTNALRRVAFAFDKNMAIFSPAFMVHQPQNITFILDLQTGEYLRKNSEQTPHQSYAGHAPIVYHEKAEKCVVVANFDAKNLTTYLYDLKTFKWEKLDIENPPGTNRRFYNLMYEPKNQVVFLFGGHDGRNANYTKSNPYYNDTWVFDIEKKEWKELKTPGPSILKAKFSTEYEVLTYSAAYAFDTRNECITFSDPDRGVWAFKYDPKQEIPADLPENPAINFGDKINYAKLEFKEKPKESTVSNEIFRTLPSGYNQKLVNLADNTITPLKGRLNGSEISWAYSPKLGVFFDYGGCGNNSAPFWGGYGNDLSYYDPVTEQPYTRRTGDITGTYRPGTGCTRSIIWDKKREVFWFLGGTGSGPYQPNPTSIVKGNYVYDPVKDIFSVKTTIGNNVDVSGYHTYLSYNEDADAFIAPQADGKTSHFICAESRWEVFADTNSFGPLTNYTRTVYVSSKKKTFAIYPIGTGKTSQEQPEGWLDTKKVAENKSKTIWLQDKKESPYKEFTLATLMYDAIAKKWEKLETKETPSFRNNKFGLAYDPINDIVYLVGGHIGWNGPVVNDMWAYHVQKNEWELLQPTVSDPKIKPVLSGCLRTDFDTRHNVLIFVTNENTYIWAYRYKKGDWKPEKQ